jgi:hypothetical protein
MIDNKAQVLTTRRISKKIGTNPIIENHAVLRLVLFENTEQIPQPPSKRLVGES